MEKVPFKEVGATFPGSLWQFLSVLLFDCTVIQRELFLRRLYTHKPIRYIKSLLQKTSQGPKGKGKLSEMLQMYVRLNQIS